MVIFGQKIRVKKIKGLGEKQGLAGFYDPFKKEIAIDASLKGDAFMQTLLHELVHAVMDRVGISQTRTSHDVHEMVAENVATALVENFRMIKK